MVCDDKLSSEGLFGNGGRDANVISRRLFSDYRNVCFFLDSHSRLELSIV